LTLNFGKHFLPNFGINLLYPEPVGKIQAPAPEKR
jgi:hypothetical protein